MEDSQWFWFHVSFFQELAAVATQLPDIRWLGRQIFMWCGNPKEDDVWEGHFLRLVMSSCDSMAIVVNMTLWPAGQKWGPTRICGMISLPSTRTKELTWRNKSTAITSARCSDCNRHHNTFSHKILTYPNIIWHDLTSFLFSPWCQHMLMEFRSCWGRPFDLAVLILFCAPWHCSEQMSGLATMESFLCLQSLFRDEHGRCLVAAGKPKNLLLALVLI